MSIPGTMAEFKENKLESTKKTNSFELNITNPISECATSTPIKVPIHSKSLLKHGRTLMATLSVSLGSLGLGTVIGYTSPAIPDINSNPAPFHLNELEIALVASIICLGGLIGEPIGGYFVSHFGRKFSLVLTTLPFVVGWLMITAAPDVIWMCIGRFLTGMCCGFVDIAVPVYISEISAPSVRGFMGSCHELLINVGYLFVFAFSCFLSWNWLAVACGAVPVVMFLLILFIPESPRWLLSNGHKEEAIKALTWFRGESEDISEELEEMQSSLTTSGSSMPLKDFREPIVYKPFLIIVGLLFFQQFAGYGVIPEYMGSIFQSAGSHMNPNMQTVVVGVAGVLANFLSALIVDKAGRRTLLLISGFIMTLSLSALASYFTIKHCDLNFDLSIISWLPMLSLVAYNFGVAIGYGPIPFYLSSELFPLKARGIAGSFGISFVWLFSFLTTFFFPVLLQGFNEYGLYWMMAGFALFGVLFAFVAVPETKGKSLEEIEKHFGK